MGGLRIDSGPILTHMRASLSWIVETVAPEIQQHVSCLGMLAAAREGGELALRRPLSGFLVASLH